MSKNIQKLVVPWIERVTFTPEMTNPTKLIDRLMKNFIIWLVLYHRFRKLLHYSKIVKIFVSIVFFTSVVISSLKLKNFNRKPINHLSPFNVIIRKIPLSSPLHTHTQPFSARSRMCVGGTEGGTNNTKKISRQTNKQTK